jgi:hypothetical protein
MEPQVLDNPKTIGLISLRCCTRAISIALARRRGMQSFYVLVGETCQNRLLIKISSIATSTAIL